MTAPLTVVRRTFLLAVHTRPSADGSGVQWLVMSVLLLSARLVLAAVFLLAGTAKLVDSPAFRRALLDFGTPAKLVNAASVLLPVLELAVAVSLIPTSLAWYGAWAALALLTLFCIAIGFALLRGRRPDCRCFGRLSAAPIGVSTWIRNGVWMACATFVVWRGDSNPGVALWPWFISLGQGERKAAIVATCAAAFVFFLFIDRLRPDRPNEESTIAPADSSAAYSEDDAPSPDKGAEPPRQLATGIGLPAGTPAPEFQLPALSGETRSLRSLQAGGNDLLLIFSSPHCPSCVALAPLLLRWTRELENLPDIVLISRGTVAENLSKLQGFDPSRVLLQREFEISEAYDCTANPSAVLIDGAGLISSELVAGGDAIHQLMASRGNPATPPRAERQARSNGPVTTGDSHRIVK